MDGLIYGPSIDSVYPWYFKKRRQTQLARQRWLYDRATQQIVIADASGGFTTESIFYNQSPAVQTGFIAVLPLLTDQGNAITVGSDGIIGLPASAAGTRQTFSYNLYNPLTSAFYGAGIAAVNNQAPIPLIADSVFAVERGQTITPVDLTVLFQDPEGDVLIYGMRTVPPGATDVDGLMGLLAGITPDANSFTTEIVRATDPYGDYVDVPFTLIVGNVRVPDLAHLSQDGAESTLESVYFVPVEGTPVYSTTVPLGEVVSQSPAADNYIAPFSSVTYVLSLGSTGAVLALGVVGNRTYAQNTGTKTIDFSALFEAASMFSIAEPLTNSEVLLGSQFTVQTSNFGTFGPFTVTGTNATDMIGATLPPFYYTVTKAPEPPSDSLPDRPATTLRIFLLGK